MARLDVSPRRNCYSSIMATERFQRRIERLLDGAVKQRQIRLESSVSSWRAILAIERRHDIPGYWGEGVRSGSRFITHPRAGRIYQRWLFFEHPYPAQAHIGSEMLYGATLAETGESEPLA